jgi:tetratricopeptide (TPR) repeat protein
MYKRIPPILKILLGLAILVLLAIGLYFVPPIHAKLGWRLNNLWESGIYFFHPPQDVTFHPSGQSQSTPTLGGVLNPTPTSTANATATPPPTELTTDTPTITPTPIPGSVILSNVPFENQNGCFNFCGPANLTMALEYWGWKGDPSLNPDLRVQVGQVIMPGVDDPKLATYSLRSQSDVNVMPYEMVDFVNEHTTYKALFRYGGDSDLLKRLIAAGFPAIIEKGIYEPLRPENTVQWGGHYAFTTGYDDAQKDFIWQDSYLPLKTSVGKNTKTSYDEYLSGWRAFDYVFIVVYPADRETELDQVLGPWGDQYWAAQHALDIANQESQSQTITGNDLFFAMFNQVTSYINLQNPDYGKAGAAYDQANTYYNNQLIQFDKANNVPLPYRIMWYETAPYFAYYNTGRYQDVINLAEVNLNKIMATRSLEESWYWEARAEYALGNYDTADADIRKALYYHPGFQPALDMFSLWGVSP